MNLFFNIENQKIFYANNRPIISDSVRYLTAQFGFSEDWDGTTKTAIFSGKGGTYEVLLTNDSCTVPHEVISGRFGVSVFGIRDGVRITTDTAYLCVQQSGYLPGETPAEPTPSVYEQIIGKIAEEETNRQNADEALTDSVNSALGAETAARLELDERLTMIQDGTELHRFSEVETALNDKQDKLTFDNMPIGDSKNPVTSDGVKKALLESETTLRVEFDQSVSLIKDGIELNTFSGVETALDKKQDKLTFDYTPTKNSSKPVTSDGIKTALDGKVDKVNENGSVSVGENADAGDESVAIGENASASLKSIAIGKQASANAGVAIGTQSLVEPGGIAVGNFAVSYKDGVSIGESAISGYGIAIGNEAKVWKQGTTDSSGLIDAIQLGTGTNSTPKTMQVYDYTMMDADGTIPEERLADLSLAKTNENNNFTAAQTINGTLTVNGDIVQNGASYESHAEQLFTKNDLIKTREGAVGGLSEDEYTGIEAEKYDGKNNGRLVFDANGTARVGDVGNEQPLLTRKEATELEDYELFRWNADTQRATGVHVGFGLGIATSQETGKENLIVWGASETQINQRSGNYLPITVGNLDYAVRSVLPQTSDTIPATLSANTEYYAGELATVSFALPTTGKLGQYCFVKFDSGATATTLTVTGSYAGEIPIPIANKTYEIFATWNGSKWVCSYRGY